MSVEERGRKREGERERARERERQKRKETVCVCVCEREREQAREKERERERERKRERERERERKREREKARAREYIPNMERERQKRDKKREFVAKLSTQTQALPTGCRTHASHTEKAAWSRAGAERAQASWVTDVEHLLDDAFLQHTHLISARHVHRPSWHLSCTDVHPSRASPDRA